MIEYFAEFDASTGRVIQCIAIEQPYEGTFMEAGRTYIGLPAPIDWSTQPSATHEMRIVAGLPEWVNIGTISQRRAAMTESMRQACETQIFSGFICAALGEVYLYPAKERDQANLIASVTDSLLAGGAADWRTPFWCADAAGVWEFRPHTIAQIQQVGREGKAAILAALSKNELLARQIATASAEQLAEIVW